MLAKIFMGLQETRLMWYITHTLDVLSLVISGNEEGVHQDLPQRGRVCYQAFSGSIYFISTRNLSLELLNWCLKINAWNPHGF